MGQPSPGLAGGGASEVVGADDERYAAESGSKGPEVGGTSDGGSDCI